MIHVNEIKRESFIWFEVKVKDNGTVVAVRAMKA
jgi:hypothetical protein